jgi:hypothetical protein
VRTIGDMLEEQDSEQAKNKQKEIKALCAKPLVSSQPLIDHTPLPEALIGMVQDYSGPSFANFITRAYHQSLKANF